MAFVTLPTEVHLNIAHRLDKEFQILLSLSCRRMRGLLPHYLDLSNHDKDLRLRYLRLVEKDHPEYLLCRLCARLFNWVAEEVECYRCPRRVNHPKSEKALLDPWCTWISKPAITWVTQEVVDLVLRAHEKGLKYGVPLSSLNMSGTSYGTIRDNRARIINGKLVLANHWHATVKNLLGGNLALRYKIKQFQPGFCRHYRSGFSCLSAWTFVERVILPTPGAQFHKRMKCKFYPAIHILDAECLEDRIFVISLKVCQNYGAWQVESSVGEQATQATAETGHLGDIDPRDDLFELFDVCKSAAAVPLATNEASSCA